MSDRGRTIRNRLIAAFVAVVLLNVVLAAANELLPSGRIDGDSGSSFVTSPDGTAAWFELLRRTGRQPERLTVPLTEAVLDPSTTLVVVDVWFADDDSLDAILEFVEGGGHVVVASPEGWIGDATAALLSGRRVDLSEGSSANFQVVGDDSTTRGVSSVETNGIQAWTNLDFFRPSTRRLLVDTDSQTQALAISYPLGKGTVVLVADASVFSNRFLDQADNAAFAVAVLDGRRTLFDEFSHGYIDDLVVEPLLPRSWRWTLYLLAAATVVFLLAAGRRLGPPERLTRRLPPPRRWFVESLAAILSRTEVGAAAEPLRVAAQQGLLRRAGLGTEASPEELLAAGVALGLAPADIRALSRPIETDDDALAVGRVMAAASRPMSHPTDPILTPTGAIVPGGTEEEAWHARDS